MVKEKIKVGIFPNHKNIRGTLEPKHQVPHNLSLVLDIWSDINKELLNKYEIELIWFNNNNYDDAINNITNNKYDVVVGAFVPTEERRKKVNFSDTYLMCSPIIVYSPSDKSTELLRYAKYLISIWIIPITVLIILSFTFGFLLYFVKQESPMKGNISMLTSIYFVIAGFLGQSGGILNITRLKKIKNVLSGIITFIFIYFFGIYITASTTAKSVSYLEKDYKIEYSIKDLKILTYPGGGERIIKMQGGKPVILPSYTQNIMEYYLNNKKELKLDGYLLLPFNKTGNLSEKNLKISKIILKYYHASFPVNKKKTVLLQDINYYIRKLQDSNKLFNMCSLWTDKNYVMC